MVHSAWQARRRVGGIENDGRLGHLIRFQRCNEPVEQRASSVLERARADAAWDDPGCM